MSWNPLNALLGLFSRDIGIDLGTANTLVLVRGKGIAINEPSVVAMNPKTRRVLAVGAEAKQMVGRTPANIVAVRPLRDGVISDFDVTEQMLRYFIERVHDQYAIIPRPRVVIGISSGVTEVERLAVHDATINAGAREVFLIEEPMAAAIGAGLPVQDAAGSMIVDIGGGTTEVAVISLGGIVASRWIRIAGDEMDQDIVTHMRQRYNLLIGERMAEEAKIAIASCEPVGVRGRDLKSGLAAEVTVAPEEIREAIGGSVNAILDAVTDTIEETPPELVADLLVRGIVLAGGGALLPGLVEQLQERTRMRVLVADDPLGCVVRGTGKVLGDLDRMRKAFAESQARRVPPRH
jgi:rod shape-determining protein MreB